MTALAEPFETPGLVVFDSIRLLLFVAGIFIAGYQVKPFLQSSIPGQRARFAGAGVALAVLALSRVQNLGGPPTWQFWGASAAIVLFGYGSWAWSDETPSQPRPRGAS